MPDSKSQKPTPSIVTTVTSIFLYIEYEVMVTSKVYTVAQWSNADKAKYYD